MAETGEVRYGIGVPPATEIPQEVPPVKDIGNVSFTQIVYEFTRKKYRFVPKIALSH